MGKGTAAMGRKSGKRTHLRCRRCGQNSYHMTKNRCASCGYGASAGMRKFSWQKKN